MIDLRQLIILIDDKKKLPTHLCMDLDCKIRQDDSRPLVKIINYILNYLRALSDKEIQIDLDAHASDYRLVFIVHSDRSEIPPLNDSLNDILKSYRATLEFSHEPARYVKFQLTFEK